MHKDPTLASRVYKELQAPAYLRPGVTFTAESIAKALDRPGITAGKVAATIHRLTTIGDCERVGDTFPYTYRLLRHPLVIEKARPVPKGPRKTKAFLARQDEARKAELPKKAEPTILVDELPAYEAEPDDELETIFDHLRRLAGRIQVIDLSVISTADLAAELVRRSSR